MTPFDFSKCPGYCDRARHIMLCRTHPLILKKADEPKPCLLAADQALATYLEMEEEGKARLAEIQNAIAILMDVA